MQGLSWSGEATWKKCGARTRTARGAQIPAGFRILPWWDLFPAEPRERAKAVIDAGGIGVRLKRVEMRSKQTDKINAIGIC